MTTSLLAWVIDELTRQHQEKLEVAEQINGFAITVMVEEAIAAYERHTGRN